MRFLIGLVIGLAVGITLIHMNVFGIGDTLVMTLSSSAENAAQTAGTLLVALGPIMMTIVGIVIAISSLIK